MAHLDPINPFQAWVLSDEEKLQGYVLTTLQKQVLQNERCALANRKINLQFDPEYPLKFQQEEAELKGQIGIITYLLEMSDSAAATLTNGTANQVHINSQEN